MAIIKNIIDLILCPWRFVFKNKGDNMGDLVQLLMTLKATIDGLQQQLTDAQAALDVAVKASYDKGFADGVASVQVPPTDKIYTQADLDNAVKLAVDPLMAKISDLEAVVAGIDVKISDAVNAKIAEIKGKLDELELGF